MPMRRPRLLLPFVTVPVLIVALVLAEKWMPAVFGASWFAAHGEQASVVMAVVLTLIITAAALSQALGPMLSFFGGGPTERRIRKYGRPAQGTIIALGENSGGGVVTVNDQPYLNVRVRVEDGVSAPYEADFDAVIPRTLLPQLQPGAVVRLKVDPQNPRKVVFDA